MGEQCATVKHQRCSKADKVCTEHDPHCSFTQVCTPFFVKKCCKVVSVERDGKVKSVCEQICEDVKPSGPCKEVNNCFSKWVSKKVCGPSKSCWDMEERNVVKSARTNFWNCTSL